MWPFAKSDLDVFKELGDKLRDMQLSRKYIKATDFGTAKYRSNKRSMKVIEGHYKVCIYYLLVHILYMSCQCVISSFFDIQDEATFKLPIWEMWQRFKSKLFWSNDIMNKKKQTKNKIKPEIRRQKAVFQAR